MQTTEIFIAGAGPAGAAAALKLNSLGISSVIVDKTKFPRDKICGDAISGKVMINLGRISPELLELFHGNQWKTRVWGIRFVAPNQKVIEVPFASSYDYENDRAPGFVAKRIDFDNFFAEELRKAPLVQFLEQHEVKEVNKISSGFEVCTQNGDRYRTKLYLDATGAQSRFARQYAGLEKLDAHHAGALRVYYENVVGFHEHNFIELHFLDSIIPGYFWLFPLPDGHVNVGIGMRTDYIQRKKVNLNKVLKNLISEHPVLRERFKHARPLGKVQGFGLPLGSHLRPISGDHFMLLGDAGHLIDPLTGEGIGNGIYSGVFAAEQASICLQKQDFSGTTMQAYDLRIKRVIGKEMNLSYRLQQLMARKWLVNYLAGVITRNQHLTDLISRMYTDFELRTKLVKPGFWLKLLLFKKLD